MQVPTDFPDVSIQLRLVAEQKYLYQDQPKYLKKSAQEITRCFSARHYSSITWELSHLLWALSQVADDQSILRFFFVDEAISSRVARHWFEEQEVINNEFSNVQANAQGININIREYSFTLNWSRINVLAMMIELLINVTPDVLDIPQQLTGNGLNSIKKLAAQLQKIIYHWLEASMPSVRALKKFQALDMHFREMPDHLIEKSFLNVWIELSVLEGLTKLSNFYSSVCHYLIANEQSQTEMSLNSDLSNYSQEHTVYEFICNHTDENLLESLPEIPKVFSQKQVNKLDIILHSPALIHRIPWSTLVTLCFAPIQAQLLQAQRNKLDNEYKALVINGAEDYLIQVMFIDAVNELNEQNMLACLGVLLERKSPLIKQAICARSSWINHLSQTANNPEAVSTVNEFIEQLPPNMRQQIKAVISKTKRRGFTESSQLDDEQIYVDLIAVLDRIQHHLTKFKSHINNREHLAEKYRADRLIVINEFNRRHLQ